MLLGSLLSSGGSARQQLRRLLSDGNTVADYRADVGVTGTLAVSSWANQLGSAPALAQATGGNQPIYLPFSGERYAYLSGVANNYLSTPSAAANQVTGDIAVVIRMALNSWTGGFQELVTKHNGAPNISYDFNMNAGVVRFGTSANGSTGNTAVSSVGPGYSAGAVGWLGVTRNATTGDVKFYYSQTNTNDPTAVAWAQLGTTQNYAAGAIYAGNAVVQVGTLQATAGNATGKVYRACIYNGIPAFLGGAASNSAVVDMDASIPTETTTNGSTWTASTGETWTLNCTGSKPAQIVASSQLLGDGTNHKAATSNFTLNQPFVDILVAKPITWTSDDYLCSGTAGAAGIVATTSSPRISLNAGSSVAENTGATLNAYHIIRGVFNGASSSLAVDSGTATTGNAGAGNPGGLSLFSDNAGANLGNWQIKERIVTLNTNAAFIALIEQYLRAIHGV